MLRRIHAQQPKAFVYRHVKLPWASGQISGYTVGVAIIGTMDVVFGEIDR